MFFVTCLDDKALQKQENVTFQHLPVAVFQCSGAMLGVPLDTLKWGIFFCVLTFAGLSATETSHWRRGIRS